MSKAQKLLLKLESSINPNQPVPKEIKPPKHKSTHGSSMQDPTKEKPLGKEPDKPYEPGKKQKW